MCRRSLETAAAPARTPAASDRSPGSQSSELGLVDVELLESRALQTLVYDLKQAARELVAEVLVAFDFRAQTFAIELKGQHRLDGATVEVPVVRRKKRRP